MNVGKRSNTCPEKTAASPVSPRKCPLCAYQVTDPRLVRCPRCRTLLAVACSQQCRGCQLKG